MRWRLCAALLVFIAPLQAAAQGDVAAAGTHSQAAALEDAYAAARSAIDTCTPRLDPQVDVGYERIAARCPDLARALEQSGIAQWLPRGWKESRNNLSAGSLAELRAVVEREMATRVVARAPRVERLDDVLGSLGDKRMQGGGTWSRFKKWLRDLMERRDRPEGENWFEHMVSRVGISDALVEVITYVALGAMVVLACIVVFNELNAAGLLRRRSRGGAGESEAEVPAGRAPPGMGEIEHAPLTERPRMLLELICARLTALRRLPPASALTVRELTRSVELQSALDQERLADLARTAERARYAESGVPAAALESAFEQGRELLKSVETLRAPEPLAGAAP